MDTCLTNISSFLRYRTPPLVRDLAGGFPDIASRAGKRALLQRPSIYGCIDPPIHVLVFHPSELRNNRSVTTHLWAHDLPPQALLDTEEGIFTASPLFTLLSLAPSLCVTHLTMAIYEFAGTFTVYRPAEVVHNHLQQLIDLGMLPVIDGWKPSLTPDNKLTDLWQRPPLITLNELRSFAAHIDGVRGSKKFRQAAKHVTGIASSPFEVQATMLLGLPRRWGGMGIEPIRNNYPIAFTGKARNIASRDRCYADLYMESATSDRTVVVECQGDPFHTGESKSHEDDNRRLALQSMGYTVVPLRYEQISDPLRFEGVASYISRELGLDAKPKTSAFKRASQELRHDLFIDWWTLGR
ncbi:hypothetical protein [Collinsella sp. An2]|uniref:hypothetical protein n=1 Tax=Collinsella sp. An2 TaxID=1965585 RepID=UPI00117D8F0E|nr:hypothetical protein [Collinsella sp. An2]